jgi:hypothetical protein
MSGSTSRGAAVAHRKQSVMGFWSPTSVLNTLVDAVTHIVGANISLEFESLVLEATTLLESSHERLATATEADDSAALRGGPGG